MATFGISGFFVPRMPSPLLALAASPEAPSFYDTSPLTQTLEELVDFDLINQGTMRLSLGATNVRTGESVYFDNQKTRIGPEHVLASGALPPGFPAVKIDGEDYWDGGLVSNTPLHYIWDQKPLTTALIVQVNLFQGKGELPCDLDQVMERVEGHPVLEQTALQHGARPYARRTSCGDKTLAGQTSAGSASRSRRPS